MSSQVPFAPAPQSDGRSGTKGIRVFYGVSLFITLAFTTLTASVLLDLFGIIAPVVAVLIVILPVAYLVELRFHRAILINPSRDPQNARRDSLFVAKPILGLLAGLVLIAAVTIIYPPGGTVLYLFSFGFQTAIISGLILLTGLIDMLAVWYRRQWSAIRCRLRFRAWLLVILAQQIVLAVVNLARLLGEGFIPWVFWAYMGIVCALAALILVVRLYGLFSVGRSEQQPV